MSLSVKQALNRHKLLTIPLIIACVMAWLLWPNEAAEANWFNDHYTYRQLISFTHNASVTSPRKITFSLDTAELITDGTMQSDCDDTRFTDINGDLLDYDLTGTCNNAATTYEIIFPITLNGTNAAYVYYGNPSAFNQEIDSTSYTALTPSGGDPSITNRTNEQIGPGPVAYWKMDEGVNNTCAAGDDVCDNTRHTNNGNISGAAWQKNDKCVDGKCLFFDGTDDVVTVSNKDSIDLNTGLVNGFTIEAWIRANSDGENGVGEIINKGSGTFIRISNDGTDGFADIEAQLDQFDTEDAYIAIPNGITLNQWHHVAIGYTNDSDDEITIYIDGKRKGESTGGFGGATTDSNNLEIGGRTSTNFHGFIDEIKIYPYERTSSQIRTDANAVSASGESAMFGESTDTRLSSGLVGYWKLNETSWNGTSNEVADESGNRNNGTASGNATTASGIFDKGGTFDGTGDYVSGSGSSIGSLNMYGKSELTISAWVNTSFTGASQAVINNGGTGNGYLIDTVQSSGVARVVIDQNFSGTKDLSSTSVVADGTWHHIAATLSREGGNSVLRLFVDGQLENQSSFAPYTITTSSSSFQIGTRTSINSMNGKIDDARIYNRSLSLRDIQQLYNWSPGPVGYWNLDENAGGDGTTIYDRSSESHDITIETGVIIVGGSTPVHQQTVTGTATTTTWISTSSNVTAASNQLYIAAFSGKNASGNVTSISGPPGFTSGNWTQLEDQCGSDNQTDIEIWYAYGTPTSDGTVTATMSSAPSSVSVLAVSRYSGADSTTPIPTSVAGNANGADDVTCTNLDTANPLINITTSTTNPLIYGAIARRGSALNTPISGFTEREDFQTGSSGNIAGLAIIDKAATTIGSYGVGGTIASSTDWAIAAAELKVGNSTTTDIGNKWAAGRYGSAFQFDGTDDFISIIDNTDFDFTSTDSFTLSTWFKRATKSSGTDMFISKYETTGSDGGYQLYMESDGDITCGVDTNNSGFPLDSATSTAATYDDDRWHHVSCIKDGTSSIRLYIDGNLVATDNSLTSSGTYANNDTLYFGIAGDGTASALSGRLDDIRIYRYARSPKQLIEDMNAGHPAGGSPVGSQSIYWKLDEGFGNTLNDEVMHQNGTKSSATSWKQSSDCKRNNCLYFDATGDGITIATASDTWIDFAGDEPFSGSAWIRIQSMPITIEQSAIITKWDSTTAQSIGYRLFVGNDDSDSTGYIGIQLADASATEYISAQTSTDLVQQDTWYHVAFTYNGLGGDAGTLRLYIDGKFIAKNSQNSAFIALEDIGADFVIGEYDTNDTNGANTFFAGYIDEVKMYSGALSPQEIAVDANMNAAINFGSGYNESNILSDGSGASPVGYWPLDENSGTSVTYDKSGNSFDGTLNSIITTSWTQGKHGSALQLDGTADYIDIGTGPTSIKTAAFWVYPTSTTNYFLNLTSTTDYIWSNAGTITATGLSSPTIYLNGVKVTSATLSANQWYHIAVTTTSAENASNLDIGRTQNANYLTGKIDDVRLYDYTLTQAQITYLFNRGKPISWYRFDECQNSTIYDTTGRGNNGTLSIGASGSNTTIGVCASSTSTASRANGTTGKFGAAIDFDGNDDSISITSTESLRLGGQDMSISTWIYPDSFGSYKTLYDKGTSGTAREYSFFINSTTDGWIAFGHDGTSGVATSFDIPFTTGEWQHVAIIRSGSTVHIYRNGELTETVTQSATTTNSNALSIGYNTSGSGSNWDGKIDDFRIFNYALSPAQLKTVINSGSIRYN